MSTTRKKTAIGLGVDDGQSTFNKGGLGQAVPRGIERHSYGFCAPQWTQKTEPDWDEPENQEGIIDSMIDAQEQFADAKGYAVTTRRYGMSVSGPSQNPIRPKKMAPPHIVDWLDTFQGAFGPLVGHVTDTGQDWEQATAFNFNTQGMHVSGAGTLQISANVVYNPFLITHLAPFDKAIIEIDWLPTLDGAYCNLVARSNNAGTEPAYEDVHAGLNYSGTSGIWNSLIASYQGSSVAGANVGLDVGQYAHLKFTIDDDLVLNVNGDDVAFSPNTDFPSSGYIGFSFGNPNAFGVFPFAANFSVTWIRT